MFNILEVEDKFRKSRLITDIHERKNMQGPKPNIQIIKDATYDWEAPEKLYSKYTKSTLSNARCVIKAIIKQFLDEDLWDVVPRSMPYNTKGAVCVIKESYDYLANTILEGDINKLFEVKAGRYKNTSDIKIVATTEKVKKLENKATHKDLELKILITDIEKYNLSREQIIEQLKRIS